jgi:hypothetical protein
MTASRGFRDVLLDQLYAVESSIRALFGLCVVLFVLLLVSLRFVPPGTATYVIIVVDLVSLVVVGALSGGALLACRPT